jgi:hypothetical protein
VSPTSPFAEWHDFFLLAGTAAVTLVGLLFVSLSFNLDILLHDRHAHLLAHARSTMMGYMFVLMMSLLLLAPNATVRELGLFLILFSLVWLVVSLRTTIKPRDGARHEFEIPVRRRMMGLLAYLASAVIGLDLLLRRDPANVSYLIVVICPLLGSAVWSSWMLLVEVGKLKLRERAEAERR